MRRFAALALITFLLSLQGGFAQTTPALKETKGKLVDLDLDEKTLEVTASDGKKIIFTIASTSKAMDDKGKPLTDGFKNKGFTEGSQIKVVTLEKGKIAKEVHLLTSAAPAKAPAKPTTPPAKVGSTTKTDASKTTTSKNSSSKDTGKATAKDSSKSTTKDSAAPASSERRYGKEAKGEEAKVVKIDTEKRTIDVEFVTGKKKASFTLSDKVEFFGPQGGESDIEDDRMEVGNFVKVVTDSAGKNISAVHFPYRKKAD